MNILGGLNMGKGQEGRAKPWSRRWAAAAMAAVFAMTGCVQQTDVPIVSEKTKGTPDTSGQTRKEETGQNGTGQNGAEQDGAMKEQAGIIRQLAEVPEIYEAHIEKLFLGVHPFYPGYRVADGSPRTSGMYPLAG